MMRRAATLFTAGAFALLAPFPARADVCYATWDDGNELAQLLSVDPATLTVVQATRFAEGGGLLYAAWHTGSVIDVYDISTGELTDAVALEGFDGWIWGLSTLGDTLLVLGDGREDRSGPHIGVFDPITGDLLRDVHLDLEASGLVRGLWCEAD